MIGFGVIVIQYLMFTAQERKTHYFYVEALVVLIAQCSKIVY